MQERQGTFRLYTEDESGATVILSARRMKGYNQRFATMFMETFSTMAMMDRPACYWRVLFHLVTVLDPIQFRAQSAREIGQAACICPKSAERGLALLLSDRVILKLGAKSGTRYRLSRQLASMSKVEIYQDAQEAVQDLPVIDSRGR